MKITQIEPQKKNPKRFNIFLDGVFGFGADENLVIEKRLLVGKQLDNSELEVILFEAVVGKLMERMYRWFGIRERSEKEVRDKFSILNFQFSKTGKEPISQLVIDAAVASLKQKGIVDDEKFAKGWAQSRSRKKGWRVIQAELYSKGIERGIIESIQYQVLSIEGEKETARKLLERKAGVWKNLPVLEFKKKAIEFLMRKGFEYEIAKKVVENCLEKR